MAILKIDSDRITLVAPFHPELGERTAHLGGRFRGRETGWIFLRDREAELRELCRELWGVDGSPEAAGDCVTLRIEAHEGWSANRRWVGDREIWLCGRQVAVTMPARRVTRPGKGVKFLVDRPRAHFGSLDLVRTYLENGTVFTMKDVPRMALSRYADFLDGHARWAVV